MVLMSAPLFVDSQPSPAACFDEFTLHAVAVHRVVDNKLALLCDYDGCACLAFVRGDDLKDHPVVREYLAKTAYPPMPLPGGGYANQPLKINPNYPPPDEHEETPEILSVYEHQFISVRLYMIDYKYADGAKGQMAIDEARRVPIIDYFDHGSGMAEFTANR
ncbi:hypothetical protein Q8F55_006010 [Vanrija albida]|uniref:Uncharacterized protein n=1 Tax=Vanrija albida TaxID=181172 RepID=A0ABR3Q364_9TREE